jgi:hypothetical protein
MTIEKGERAKRILDLAGYASMHIQLGCDEAAAEVLAEMLVEAEDLVDSLHEDILHEKWSRRS